MTLAVLLAHGSPDPRSGEVVRRTAAELSERLGSLVVAAFLDHDTPDLRGAAGDAQGSITVLPLLLSAAFHARVDVPAAVASLGRDVHLLDPLGHPPALLDSVLLRSGVTTVVVAAGTRVVEERAAFERAVAEASRRTGVTAFAAFATGPGARVVDHGTAAAVVPWLLAPGRLLDQVEASAQETGLQVVGAGLLHEPATLDHLAAQLSP